MYLPTYVTPIDVIQRSVTHSLCPKDYSSRDKTNGDNLFGRRRQAVTLQDLFPLIWSLNIVARSPNSRVTYTIATLIFCGRSLVRYEKLVDVDLLEEADMTESHPVLSQPFLGY